MKTLKNFKITGSYNNNKIVLWAKAENGDVFCKEYWNMTRSECHADFYSSAIHFFNNL